MAESIGIAWAYCMMTAAGRSLEHSAAVRCLLLTLTNYMLQSRRRVGRVRHATNLSVSISRPPLSAHRNTYVEIDSYEPSSGDERHHEITAATMMNAATMTAQIQPPDGPQ